MTIVRNEITDYLTINITESETLWSSGSVYDYGDEARYGHFIYAYAGASGTNTTDTPSIDELWVAMRPTNYYAMLDGRTGTQTSNNDVLEFEISDTGYDTLSLLNVSGKTLEIEMTDLNTSEIVFTDTIDLQDESSVVDFYSYCFSDFIFKESYYVQLPIYINAKVKITITNTGGVASCGRLVFGRSFFVGDTGIGASLGLESYSIKQTNEFGVETLVHRDSVNLDSYEVLVPTEKIPTLRRKGQDLDAIPILFIMDESELSNLENLLSFGYWQSFNMLVKGRNKSSMSLTIKGIL